MKKNEVLNLTHEAAKAAWDNIEVMACKVVDENGSVEPVEDDEKPDFHSVYLHQVNGGVQCIADLPTEQMAYDLANLIQNAVGSFKDNGFLDKRPFGEQNKRPFGKQNNNDEEFEIDMDDNPHFDKSNDRNVFRCMEGGTDGG